jgi:hypothetical protein
VIVAQKQGRAPEKSSRMAHLGHDRWSVPARV